VLLLKTWRDGPPTPVVTVVAPGQAGGPATTINVAATGKLTANKTLIPLAAQELEKARDSIFQQVNVLRVAGSAEAVKRDAKLDAVAQKHAENMARQGMLDHVLDGKDVGHRAKEEQYRFAKVSENIAGMTVKNQEGNMDVLAACELAVVGWKKSKGHNDNLMDPALTETGVGLARNSDGEWYFCQVFARPLEN
jgi:uncharacterized protein YkwD